MLDIMIKWLKNILLAMIIAIGIEEFIFGFTIVQGYSMYPTLNNNDKLFVNKISYFFHPPKTGDIVIFHPPLKDYQDDFFIKRVIGIENDEFSIENGKLYINGELIHEGYLNGDPYQDKTYQITSGKVPKGMIFVMGDNRNDSNDSRCFGYVPISSIEGKADFRLLPIDTAQAFSVHYE
ncbi:MAG: signal peptidase I [Bacillota bacterium]